MLTIDSSGDTAFQDIPSASWGSITGTLSSQTDLQNALNAKLSLSGGTMTGAINVPLGAAATESIRFASNTGIYSAGEGFVNLNASGMMQWNGAAGQLWLAVNSATTQLALGSSADVRIFRDAANTLAQRNSTNAQTFRVYNTFTDASNYERGKFAWESNVLRIGTEKAGTGSARALELQTDGTTRLTIEATSGATIINRLQLGSGGSNGNYAASINGRILLRTASGSGVSVGYIGSYSFWTGVGSSENLTYASYQAETHFFTNSQYVDGEQALILKSSEVVLGKNTTCTGNLTLSTKNIVTDTTTGTKIGTATTQKLGFYDKTPVVQPAAVADATDAASVITQLNLLLSRMRDLGLIAT